MKKTEAYIPLLIKTKLFSSIPEEKLRILLSCMNPLIRQYKKGETIGRSGEELRSIPLLLSGEVSVYREDFQSPDDSERTLLAKFPEGRLFGEIGALSGSHRWPADAMASKESEVMFLPLSYIISSCEKGCSSHKALIQNLLVLMADRTILLTRRVEYLSTSGIRSRLLRFLRDEKKRTGSSTIHCSMNREELARFLGVTRPSLSREMKNLKEEGIIDYYKNTIRLLKR